MDQGRPVTDLILSASFEKTGMEPTACTGILSLYHGKTKVGEGPIKTQLGAYSIAGSGLYVGRQSGEPVTRDYRARPRTRSRAGRSTGSRWT